MTQSPAYWPTSRRVPSAAKASTSAYCETEKEAMRAKEIPLPQKFDLREKLNVRNKQAAVGIYRSPEWEIPTSDLSPENWAKRRLAERVLSEPFVGWVKKAAASRMVDHTILID